MLTNTCTCSLTFVNLYRVRFFLVQNVARSIKWHLFTDLFFCQKFGVSTSPSCQKLMPVKSSKLFIFLPHLSHAIFSCSCLRICKKELKLTKFCSCVLKTSSKCLRIKFKFFVNETSTRDKRYISSKLSE